MVVVLTYWLSYEYVRDPRRALEPESAGAALLRGAFHVLSLLMPYLDRPRASTWAGWSPPTSGPERPARRTPAAPRPRRPFRRPAAGREPDNMTLLKIYALYKQATAGDVDGKRPGFTDMVGRAKWDAWNELKGKSGDEAKQEYIDLIESLK